MNITQINLVEALSERLALELSYEVEVDGNRVGVKNEACVLWHVVVEDDVKVFSLENLRGKGLPMVFRIGDLYGILNRTLKVVDDYSVSDEAFDIVLQIRDAVKYDIKIGRYHYVAEGCECCRDDLDGVCFYVDDGGRKYLGRVCKDVRIYDGSRHEYKAVIPFVDKNVVSKAVDILQT